MVLSWMRPRRAPCRPARSARPALELLEERSLLSAGALDPTFSGDGQVSFDINLDDRIHAVAVQPDGGIVVAGSVDDGVDSAFLVGRFLPNGDIDNNFSGEGFSIIDFNPNTSDQAEAVAIQPDGRILVVGTSNSNFALARRESGGDVDPLFGGGDGITITDFGGIEEAFAVLVLPNGKIVVGGRTTKNGTSDFALARYHANGSPDLDFGNAGRVITDFDGGLDRITALALQPDGKIVAVGSTTSGTSDFALARYNPNGALDGTFGEGGKLTTDYAGKDDRAEAVALMADGRIVVAGSMTNNDIDFALARYNSDGDLDLSFEGGIIFREFSPGDDDFAKSVLVETDGSVVVAGSAEHADGREFLVARFTAAGVLDGSFGNGGSVRFGISGNDFNNAEAMAFQADGRIVVAGTTFPFGGDVAVARLQNDHFQFPIAAYAVSENGGSAILTVERIGGSTDTVVVRAQTIGGTATAGIDYLPATVDLVFGPGETSKSFSIPVVGDAAVEVNETIEVRLQVVSGSGAIGPRGRAVVTMLDDVSPPATPVAPPVQVLFGKLQFHAPTGRYRQTVRLVNASGQALHGPLRLLLDRLSKRVRVRSRGGVQRKLSAAGPYWVVNVNGSAPLAAGEVRTLMLEFSTPSRKRVKYRARVFAGLGEL